MTPAYLPDHRAGCVISILPREAMSLTPDAARNALLGYQHRAERSDPDGFYAGLVRDLEAALDALASARPSRTLNAIGAA